MCLGVPGKVAEIFERDALPMGKVDFGGILKEVCLAYVPEVAVGEYVLVHVGFAISRIDEAEANEIFSYIDQIAEFADELPADNQSPAGRPERDEESSPRAPSSQGAPL